MDSSGSLYPVVRLESDDEKVQKKIVLKDSAQGSKSNYKSRNAAPVRVPRDKRSVWPLFLYFILSLVSVVVSFLVASASDFAQSSLFYSWGIFGCFLAGVASSVIFLILIYIRLNNSKFEIRRKCVRHMAGRYSLQQEVIEINYQDIGWVRVSQSILERLMDIGTIEIGAAHSHLPEISVDGRANPHKYANMIHRRLAKNKKPLKVSIPDGVETVH